MDNINHDIIDTMRTKQGRAVVAHVLGKCNMESSSFNGQANHTIYREGRRSVGLEIVSELKEYAPELYIKMLQEKLDV